MIIFLLFGQDSFATEVTLRFSPSENKSRRNIIKKTSALMGCPVPVEIVFGNGTKISLEPNLASLVVLNSKFVLSELVVL